MPVSHWLPDATTKKLLSNIKINTFLDIGSGAGKYGKMISKYHPQCKKIGLEIDAKYIEEYNLHEIYDEILNFPAIDLISSSTRRDDLLLDENTIQRMWVLRKYLADMNPVEAMESMNDRFTKTVNNEEFLISMNS